MNYRDDRIRAAKAAKRLSEIALARLAKVSRSTVSQACNGKSISLPKLQAIAGALEISPADLFEPKAEEAVQERGA